MDDLRLLEHLRDRVDRADRHARPFEGFHEIVPPERADALAEARDQRHAVLHARLVGDKPRIVGEAGSPYRLTQAPELAVVADRNDQVAILGRERLVGDQIGMAVPHTRPENGPTRDS